MEIKNERETLCNRMVHNKKDEEKKRNCNLCLEGGIIEFKNVNHLTKGINLELLIP